MKITINDEELVRLYSQKHLKIKEIAEVMGVSRDTIRRSLQRLGLKKGTSYKVSLEKTDKFTDYKAKIKQLYESGKSTSQIAAIVGKSPRTVVYHINKLNCEKHPLKKIDEDKFDELWKAGKTDQEIADFFGVALTTIKTYRTKGKNGRYNIIRYFAQESHLLTEEQEQMIRGSLLGDMSLTKPSRNCSKNSRLAIVHCAAQKDLFLKKVELLDDFMGKWKEIIPAPDKRTGKVYTTYRGNSKTHKVFTDLYNELYFDGVKKITKEYLNKITSPIALAYWFMDDGCVDGTIATNCFDKEEVLLLHDWLLNTYKIDTTIHCGKNNYTLYIYSKKDNRKKFEKLIAPYFVGSMRYKLKYR